MIDEPHEKLYAFVLLIILFSFVHYQIYVKYPADTHYKSSHQKPLTYIDFLWYSAMVTFTMPMGDIHPQSGLARTATGVQGAIFLTVLLI